MYIFSWFSDNLHVLKFSTIAIERGLKSLEARTDPFNQIKLVVKEKNKNYDSMR
jgi:hypothetical protein